MKKMTKTAIKNFLKSNEGAKPETVVKIYNGDNALEVTVKRTISLLDYMDMMQYALDTCFSDNEESTIQSCVDFAWRCAVVRAYTNIDVDDIDIEEIFTLVECMGLYDAVVEASSNNIVDYYGIYIDIVERRIKQEMSTLKSFVDMIGDFFDKNSEKFENLSGKDIVEGLNSLKKIDETKVAQAIMDMNNKSDDVNADSK